MTAAIELDRRFDLHNAPVRVGRVRLKVRNLARVVDYYRNVLGLDVIESGDDTVVLGTPARALLELTGDPGLAPRDPRAAGLFHIAFLLPARADLARWLRHVSAGGIAIGGASDHGVSEAIYLADPEGNGIEVYADRPMDQWYREDGTLHMPTDPLDVHDLSRVGVDTAWNGMPDDGVIGHVHLQVGDTIEAERFYRDILGFDVTARYPGGSFLGAGGYHHQVAANTWRSRGARVRPADMAGLESFELITRDRASIPGVEGTERGGAVVLRDPWGIDVKVTREPGADRALR